MSWSDTRVITGWAILALGFLGFCGIFAYSAGIDDRARADQMKACVKAGHEWRIAENSRQHECVER